MFVGLLLAFALFALTSCQQLVDSCTYNFGINDFAVAPNPAKAGKPVVIAWNTKNTDETMAICTIYAKPDTAAEYTIVENDDGDGVVVIYPTETLPLRLVCNQLCGDDATAELTLVVNNY